MAPKNKGKAKDDSGSTSASSKSSSKLKPATSINVRHILCEKHSVKEEALKRIADGEKFDDVARSLSEDKKRQGTPYSPNHHPLPKNPHFLISSPQASPKQEV
jgi:NIMA-interacting peptidyl-prolyl cis-trans isomerase 4